MADPPRRACDTPDRDMGTLHGAPRVVDGRYVLRHTLGEGGIGRVFAATDRETGASVAVKLMHRHVVGETDAVTRFGQELEAAKRVRHPHVVRYLGAGVHDGQPYLVTELVEGPSLADHLAARGRLAPADAVRMARQIAQGVCALHEAGVIHRDLKPGNVLLTGSEAAPDAKLADLGFARLDDREITAVGFLVGTRTYMAPEQVAGERHDARTDVYGLGAVLFAALTGDRPFAGKTHKDIMAGHLVAPPPSPSTVVGVPAGLDRVVTTAMRKVPDNRYPTMAALSEDLQQLERGAAPLGYPMQVMPDIYQGRSHLGRSAVRVLTRHRQGLASVSPAVDERRR